MDAGGEFLVFQGQGGGDELQAAGTRDAVSGARLDGDEGNIGQPRSEDVAEGAELGAIKLRDAHGQGDDEVDLVRGDLGVFEGVLNGIAVALIVLALGVARIRVGEACLPKPATSA